MQSSRAPIRRGSGTRALATVWVAVDHLLNTYALSITSRSLVPISSPFRNSTASEFVRRNVRIDILCCDVVVAELAGFYAA